MSVRFITRTAILLALTIVFQYLGRYIPLGPNSQFIVGPLVNACLLISAATVGLAGGAVIAILAPVAAVLTTHTPVAAFLVPFSPIVAAGNFILVLTFILLKEKNKFLGIFSAAVLKFGILFAGAAFYLEILGLTPKLAKLIYFSFGWSQLVTALVGGILALLVIKSLEKQRI